MRKKSIKYQRTTSRKRGTGRICGKKRRKQTGVFLSRYDFAYAGRDTVNQVGKIALNIIKNATSQIDKIAKDRIDQAIRTGGSEIERIAPKIIRGAIEDVYKTPFRLLENLKPRQETISKNKKTIV